ncbi:hypothetical protein NSQ43_07245 [Sporosarcina sp. FSL W8-0480]|uniref:hypothetical protein n=1 Tax=Sporosarcina sp. FSL W8-0480 TaxID=2954701 RepID=UPI0030D8442C
MRDCEINVVQAVENNIAWCKLICEAYRKRSYTTGKVWALITEAPTYYPELIIMNRTTKDTDILEFLKLNYISSVKDSFAALDLSSYGYQMLYIVSTKKEFERWTNLTGLELP